jgi:glycosyltransferase involved in cell wall biosynthesis
MPIHNQEKIIINTLNGIINNITSDYEIILILDNCIDNTEKIVLNYFENEYKYLCELTIIKQDTPLFETACDNIGFKLSKGKYIIEVQADIEIQDKSFEKILSKPCKELKNVIGVSGRCSHNFINCNIGIGKLGNDILKKIEDLPNKVDRNIFYSYETCNRGPLLLDKEKLIELNYLDEKNFCLDNSDHDLFARAYYYKKYICGYIPIEFNTILEHGSTRKPRDKLNIETLNELCIRSNGGFYMIYRNYIRINNIEREPIIYKLKGD